MLFFISDEVRKENLELKQQLQQQIRANEILIAANAQMEKVNRVFLLLKNFF